MSSDGEILLERPDGLRLAVHASPPAGFAELLSRTVWGTGSVRYAMLDVEDQLQARAGAHFLALTDRGRLVGTYVLAPRTLRAGGRTFPALYRTLLAVDPARGREGLGSILVREARRHFVDRATRPIVAYGFIEAENAASLASARSAGYERWGTFLAAVFTRLGTRDDARVEEVPEREHGAIAGRLADLYGDHTAWDFGAALRRAPCFALRSGGEVRAAAQMLTHRWRLDGLEGISGWVARRVLPRLPVTRRLGDPERFAFAFFGSLYAAPGAEGDLVRLLETLLARAGLHSAMIYLDPRGAAYAALQRGGGLGLVHTLGVRPRVEVMAAAAHLTAGEIDDLRGRPISPSMEDDA